MGEVLLGAGEAGRRLGVAPTTVQRWVDSGVLTAVRTQGGHRRIALSEIRRLLAAKRPNPVSGPLRKWIAALLGADAAALRTRMLTARRTSGNWSVVVEEIAAAMAEIGRLWELGSCQIFEEHAASEALHRAASRCSAEIPRRPKAPSAALLTVVGDRHTLGLSLAELVVAEAGWKADWFGDGPPPEELAQLIERRRPCLLVVAASAATPRKAVLHYQTALERIARRAKVDLVLAGDGPWASSAVAYRVYSFGELCRVLPKLKAAPRELPSRHARG